MCLREHLLGLYFGKRKVFSWDLFLCNTLSTDDICFIKRVYFIIFAGLEISQNKIYGGERDNCKF